MVRDPYARWCGRGGVARRPPIPILRREPSSGRALFVVMTTQDASMAATPPGSPPAGTGGRRGPYPRLRPGRSLFGGARARAPRARPPKGGSLASGGADRRAHDGQDDRLREGLCGGSLTLGDHPEPVVRIACERCGRAGRYRLEGLAERFGADAVLPNVLLALASCERRDRGERTARAGRADADRPGLRSPRTRRE